MPRTYAQRSEISRLRRVHREPAPDAVAQRLRTAIISGEIPPGTRIRQEDLADRLAVSRAPVRQALVVLEREGLVQLHRWRGAIVAPLDVPFINDLYEFRGAVERFVAETLAKRPNYDAASMWEIVTAGRDAAVGGDFARLFELDLRFHTRLYEMVGNRVLIDVMSRQWTHTKRVMWATLKVSGWPTTAWEEHARILEAIDAHDAALAGSRAATHMESVRARIAETFARELLRLQQVERTIASPHHRRKRRTAMMLRKPKS